MSGKINLLGIIRVGNGPVCSFWGLSSCSTQIELKSYYPVYFRVNAANGLALLFPRIPGTDTCVATRGGAGASPAQMGQSRVAQPTPLRAFVTRPLFAFVITSGRQPARDLHLTLRFCFSVIRAQPRQPYPRLKPLVPHVRALLSGANVELARVPHPRPLWAWVG